MSKTITGDVAVGRHVYTGGDVNVSGSATIKRNLKVEGWLDARNIKSANKGLFASETALRTAYPEPATNGWWALVGNSIPAQVWRVENSRWRDTGETSSDLNIDLTGYVGNSTFEAEIERINKTDEEQTAAIERNTTDIKGKKEVTGIDTNNTTEGYEVEMILRNANGETSDLSFVIPLATSELAGLLPPNIRASWDSVESNAFVWAVTDAQGKMLLGVTKDGNVDWGKGIPTPVRKALQEMSRTLSSLISDNARDISFVRHSPPLRITTEAESPEWVWTVTDAEGKLLLGIKDNGNVDWSKGIPTPIKEALTPLRHISESSTPEEYLEVTLDADNRILGYRGKDGRRHEAKMSIGDLTLSDKAVDDLAKALKKAGIGSDNVMDWSAERVIQIGEPCCGIVNLSNITRMPTTKNDDMQAWLDFWDMQGNYFRKRVILNAQGSSSLYHPKKNYAVDFCEDEWAGDETTSIRIGNWVAQDSFHVKAFYYDAFRGICPVAYKIWDEVYRSRGVMNDRPYKRLFVDKYQDYGYGYANEPTDVKENFGENARTFPDGFPVLTYLNGKFYGVFSWQLKKHRDNMAQNKKNPNHIHLDLAQNSPWSGTGGVEWTDFEIRNPKDLYCQDGTKYDGDNPKELMGVDSPYYDSGNDKHVLSSQVKGHILGTRAKFMSFRNNYTRLKEVREDVKVMIDANAPADEIAALNGQIETNITETRNAIKEIWDVDTVIDYIIMTQALGNTDSYFRNIQWATWDGERWAASPYDWDSMWGTGLIPVARSVSWFKYWTCDPERDNPDNPKVGLYQPFAWVFNYFGDELRARYKVLRSKGILSTDNIIRHLHDWIMRVGIENYERDFELWPQTPSWRDSHIDSGHWRLTHDNMVTPDGNDVVQYKDSTGAVVNVSRYNATKTYNEGDECFHGFEDEWGNRELWRFKCVSPCIGQPPVTAFYDRSPYTLGHHASIYRVKKWSDEMIAWLDGQLGLEN